ncbi:hypothetical protein [Acetobacter pasteurianus]|uniref:hypothetical protein n=1 Tax=Acetobacter pasteurianus TaxID=438 RepID=UPI0012F710CA|nr:hypothetical protein [Acetobacter pasteurianus]
MLEAYELQLSQRKRHLWRVVKTLWHLLHGRVRKLGFSETTRVLPMEVIFSFSLVTALRCASPRRFKLSSKRFFLTSSEITNAVLAFHWQLPTVRLSAEQIAAQLFPAFTMRSRDFTSAAVHALITHPPRPYGYAYKAA